MSRNATPEGRQTLLDALEPAVETVHVRVEQAPAERPAATQHKGLAPARSRMAPPSWWKGDQAAFRSMVEGARDLGERVPSDVLSPPGRPGRR